MTFKNKFIYFGLVCVFVAIGVGATYFEKNEEKLVHEPNVIYTWYTTQDKGFVSNNEYPQLSPAPKGYLWYVNLGYGIAFLYPEQASVNFCSDTTFCEKFSSNSGIIINTTPSSEIIPGEKTGWDSVKQDLYGLDIKIIPYSMDNYPTPIEQTIIDVINTHNELYGVDPMIFTEQNRGTYEADYTKPLPTVYFINKQGAFLINSLPNDLLRNPDTKFCITNTQDNCVKPTQSYEDYIKIQEYINTIVQSFTVIE